MVTCRKIQQDTNEHQEGPFLFISLYNTLVKEPSNRC